ncbi:MAG: LPS assembly lipoprotein LptE [Rhodospirillales bacterium]
MYGHKGAVNASNELASIRISPIKDRIGQELHNYLLDLFNPHGRPVHPQYTLEVALKASLANIAVSKEAIATRVNFHLNARFSLYNKKNGKRVYGGLDQVITGYNILSSSFATKSAEFDARSRATRQVAFNIQTQIASFFKTNPPKATPSNVQNLGGSR